MRRAPTIHVQPLAARASVDAVLARVADRPEVVVLDSADATRGRYTVIAFDPVERMECPAGGPDPFLELRQRMHALSVPTPVDAAPPLPFVGGWIGYFAYEAGRYIERLPATSAADIGLPVARFGLYDTAAIHDARTDRWTVVAAGSACMTPSPHTRPSPAERIAEWSAILDAADTAAGPSPPPPVPGRIEASMTRTEFMERVDRAREYIAAGDIFQVNLARRLTLPAAEPAMTTYRRLRRLNPAAYAAFLQWPQCGRQPARHRPLERLPVGRPRAATPSPHAPPDDACAILSASPELFLELSGRSVVTRPIKGTRPRHEDPILDEAMRMELAASPKDRAELAMIVDLERNDLGRVCEYGSIRVFDASDSPARPYAVETHPTVHHLVATITGRLAPGHDAVDLLRACFPGGSITGAPKVRAMQIIDELEPTERGVYTGAIGYLSLHGRMAFNVAIRTIIRSGGRIHVYAGGGIVADSVPEDEYLETEAKALGLCAAVGAAGAVIQQPAAPVVARHGCGTGVSPA